MIDYSQFGQLPPDVDLKIRQICEKDSHRKYENLVREWKIRRKHDIRVIRTVNERMGFLLMVWAESNPNNPISQAVIDTYYKNNKSLQNLNLLSSDTILRDNRAMEDAGLFPKAVEEKPVVQATLF